MLQNIRCFIVYIVIIVLGSFRKQGIVVSFFALEHQVVSNFVSNFLFFCNRRLVDLNKFLFSDRGETGNHLVSLRLLGGE